MKSLSYWQQFAATGKIADYLRYSCQERQEEMPKKQEEMSKQEETSRNQEETLKKQEETEVQPYAGIHIGNGNCSESGACRGI